MPAVPSSSPAVEKTLQKQPKSGSILSTRNVNLSFLNDSAKTPFLSFSAVKKLKFSKNDCGKYSPQRKENGEFTQGFVIWVFNSNYEQKKIFAAGIIVCCGCCGITTGICSRNKSKTLFSCRIYF